MNQSDTPANVGSMELLGGLVERLRQAALGEEMFGTQDTVIEDIGCQAFDQRRPERLDQIPCERAWIVARAVQKSNARMQAMPQHQGLDVARQHRGGKGQHQIGRPAERRALAPVDLESGWQHSPQCWPEQRRRFTFEAARLLDPFGDRQF